MALKTNFTDDILAESMNGKRQYNVTENSNGTKSLEDVTDYQSIGSTFSAKDMNETNAAVNHAYDDMGDEFNPEVDYAVGDYTIHNNKVWKFTTAHPAGAWDESHVKATKILSEARELNENLTWQLAGEVKGKKEILIPASAKEIYVEVGSDTSKLGTVTIPVIRLSEKDIKYNLYELYLNGQQYIRSIVVSKLRVIIGECKTADKDASSSTVTTMYYR